MNSLSLRKRLLVLEAEVHREQLARDWETACTQLRAGGEQVKAFGSFASIAALGWTALSVVFTGKRGSAPQARSLTGFLFRGLRLATVIWPAWKAIRQNIPPTIADRVRLNYSLTIPPSTYQVSSPKPPGKSDDQEPKPEPAVRSV